MKDKLKYKIKTKRTAQLKSPIMHSGISVARCTSKKKRTVNTVKNKEIY